MLNHKESEALDFVFNAHQNQIDKQGKPYVLHVLRVAFSVFEHSTENVFIAALLHDTVEDCGVNLTEVEVRFGHRVALAVDSLTRRPKETYTDYIQRVKQDAVAVKVKLADLADNMDESRMSQLDEETQKRLRKRYAKAVESLTFDRIGRGPESLARRHPNTGRSSTGS
jgi:(p)ppGpp synthase/HD superfamily hydrolase